MLNDLQTNDQLSNEFSIDLLENFLTSHKLGKNQIFSQNISQLKQSLITLNSLIADLKSDSSYLNIDPYNLHNNFDSSYILLIFIQRKSLIMNRYKKLLKKYFFNKIRFCIEKLDDSTAKEQLKVLFNKLEYIENNSQNISGQLQNFIK
jgi:hypothetical protein